jgi:hypothetical protein
MGPDDAGPADAVERNLVRLAPKVWRFGAEMRFVAGSFAAAGVPGGFHRAVGEIYERWARHRALDGAEPAIDGMLDELADRGPQASAVTGRGGGP